MNALRLRETKTANGTQAASAELTRDRYFELVKDQIEHEDDLINHRMTWLITGQAIFFGFYAALYSTALDKSLGARLSPLIFAFSITALCTCVFIFVSIFAAVMSLSLLREQLDNFYSFESWLERPIPNVSASHWPIRYAGLAAPLAIPPIFIGTWLWILFSRFA